MRNILRSLRVIALVAAVHTCQFLAHQQEQKHTSDAAVQSNQQQVETIIDDMNDEMMWVTLHVLTFLVSAGITVWCIRTKQTNPDIAFAFTLTMLSNANMFFLRLLIPESKKIWTRITGKKSTKKLDCDCEIQLTPTDIIAGAAAIGIAAGTAFYHYHNTHKLQNQLENTESQRQYNQKSHAEELEKIHKKCKKYEEQEGTEHHA